MKNLFIRLTNIANMEYNYQAPNPMNRTFTKGNGWKMTPPPQTSTVWLDKSPTRSTGRVSRGGPDRKRGFVPFSGGPRHPTRRDEFQQPQQPLDRWDMGRTNEMCSRTPFYDYRYDTQRDFGIGAQYHDYEGKFKPVHHQAPGYVGDYGQHSQSNPNWTEYVNHQVYFGVQPGNDCVPNGFYMVENQQVFQPNDEFPETGHMIYDSTRTFHKNNRNNPNRIENVNRKVYFGAQPANNYIPKNLCMAENQQVFQPNNEFPETAKVGYNSSRAPHENNPDEIPSTSERTVCNNNLNNYSQNEFLPFIEQNDLLSSLIMATLFEPHREEIQHSVPEHHNFCPNETTSNITNSKSLKVKDEMALDNLDFSYLTLPCEKQISNALTLQDTESSFLSMQQACTEENFEKSLMPYNPASVMHGTNNQSNKSIGGGSKSMTISEFKDDAKSDENVSNYNGHLVLAQDNQSLSTESVTQVIQQNQLSTSLLSQVASGSLEFQEDILTDNLFPCNDKNTNFLDLIKYLDPAETETYRYAKPNNADSRCEMSKQLLHNKDNKFMSEIEEAVLNISSESFVPNSLNIDDVDTFKLKSQIPDDNSDQIEVTLSSIMNYILEEPEKSSDSLFSTVGEDDTSEDLNPCMATNSAQKPKRTKKLVKKIYKEVKTKTKKSRCQKNTKANLDKDREEVVEEYFAESFETNDCASENETRVPNRFSCDVEVQVDGGDFTDSKDKFAKKRNAETQWEDMGEGSEEESEWLWKKIKSVLKYARRSSSHSNNDRNKTESDIEEPLLGNEMHRTCDEACPRRLNKDSDTIEKEMDHSVVKLKKMVADHGILDNSTIEHFKTTESSPPIMSLLDEKKCKIPYSPRINKDFDTIEKGVDHSVIELERIVGDHEILDNSTIELFKNTESSPPPITTLLDENKCKIQYSPRINKDLNIIEKSVDHFVVELERVVADHRMLESSTPENYKIEESSFPSIKTSFDGEKCKILHPLSLARSSSIKLVEVKSEGSSDTHLSLSPTPVKRTSKSGKLSSRKSKFSAKNARKSNKTQSTAKCSVPNKNVSQETNGKLEQRHTLEYSSGEFHLSDSETINSYLEDDSLNSYRVLRKRKIQVSSEPPTLKRRCISGSDSQFQNEFSTSSENGIVDDICDSVR